MRWNSWGNRQLKPGLNRVSEFIKLINWAVLIFSYTKYREIIRIAKNMISIFPSSPFETSLSSKKSTFESMPVYVCVSLFNCLHVCVREHGIPKRNNIWYVDCASKIVDLRQLLNLIRLGSSSVGFCIHFDQMCATDVCLFVCECGAQ